MTTKPEHEPYTLLAERALDALATRTIMDPEAPDEHVQAATQRLMHARMSERDLDAWIRAQPAGLLHDLRAVLQRHREHDARAAGERESEA